MSAPCQHQDATSTEMGHLPDKHETAKEPEDAQISDKSGKTHLLWGRVKDAFPEIVEAVKRESKSKTNNGEKRRSDTSQKTTSSVDRLLSLSEKGREFKRRLTLSNVKQIIRPKQKDPLHQWFVDHSGGTLRETR
ncbi:hypothetical protein F4677DRAFT_450950 [Hypoxylon crocopeplum]|nr:hypothetical protein F4677DRAFT_450950 [Hypoxylon crocopeplum]